MSVHVDEIDLSQAVRLVVVGTVQYAAICITIMAVIHVLIGLGTVVAEPYGSATTIGHMDNALTQVLELVGVY